MTTVNHTMTTELIQPLPNDQKVLKSAKTTHRTSIDTMSAGNKTPNKSRINKDSKVSDLGETNGAKSTARAKVPSQDTPTQPQVHNEHLESQSSDLSRRIQDEISS